MTRIYQHSTGRISRNGKIIATGYAGIKDGKNNPAMQNVAETGPLPRERYTLIGPPFTHPHTGACSIRLKPAPGNSMYVRAGFLIHGDSRADPGNASNGCIVMPLNIMILIWSSGDRNLEVVQ